MTKFLMTFVVIMRVRPRAIHCASFLAFSFLSADRRLLNANRDLV